MYDILKTTSHSNFPVVDANEDGILYGTIGRGALSVLLKRRAFGLPRAASTSVDDSSIVHNYLSLDGTPERFFPLVQYDKIEKAYPKYPSISDITLNQHDRNCLVDLRPYCNTAPVTVRETSTISVSAARLTRLKSSEGIPFCSQTSNTCLFVQSEHTKSFGPSACVSCRLSTNATKWWE